MRNRAKCKLCFSVIESFHAQDYVFCKCGEIAIDGGEHSYKTYAKDWSNFLRVDDKDNEFPITVIDKDSKEKMPEEVQEPQPSLPERLSREEQIDMLDSMLKNIENLPPQAMSLPINHYDFYSFMILISSILRN